MRVFREIFILILGAAALMYLFAPSFLPDILPLVGWLDEGLATTILLSVLNHYGINLTGLFGDDQRVKVESLTSDGSGKSKKRTVKIPREVLERALREYEQEQRLEQSR